MGTWKVRNLRGLASPILCEASTRLSHRHKDIEKPCASDLPPCVTQVAHWPTAVSQTSFVGGTSTSLDAPEEQECTANTLPVLVVSMNTKGVLADLASAVIRKPDLRCLALAIQILSKEVLERQER